MAELGLFAAVLLIASAFLWIKSASKAPFTLEQWWMWALLSVLGIHSFLEYPLWYSYFLGIAAILLGAGEIKQLRPDFSRIGRSAFIVMLLFGLYGMLGIAQSYSKLEHIINRAQHHQIADGELKNVNQELLRLHKESMLTPYVELMYATSLVPSKSQLDNQLYITESAMHFFPTKEVAYHYLELLELKGDKVAAERQRALVKKAYP
jgi:hypothetical protein